MDFSLDFIFTCFHSCCSSIITETHFLFCCFKGYGVEDGAFCGVFDGHGKNGHIVSKIVRNSLPTLLLGQKNALEKMKRVADGNNEEVEDVSLPSKNFYTWKEACVNAFKVMDKEIKLQENLDCSCSGTTAVVVLKQVSLRKKGKFLYLKETL